MSVKELATITQEEPKENYQPNLCSNYQQMCLGHRTSMTSIRGMDHDETKRKFSLSLQLLTLGTRSSTSEKQNWPRLNKILWDDMAWELRVHLDTPVYWDEVGFITPSLENLAKALFLWIPSFREWVGGVSASFLLCRFLWSLIEKHGTTQVI